MLQNLLASGTGAPQPGHIIDGTSKLRCYRRDGQQARRQFVRFVAGGRGGVLSCRAMRYVEKAVVMDAARINRSISRLASEILERNRGVEGLVLAGIRRRGVPLAERVADRIAELEGTRPVVTKLDIAFYDDELGLVAPDPVVGDAPLPVSIDDSTVVIVDDVLYTGRTILAAVDKLFKNGRPRRIQLAVLIDRGHRELPIQADYIGKIVPTKSGEIVKVMLVEVDGAEQVTIVEPAPAGEAQKP
jgi:pyrimidine operon attenuation protein/uracil phosphoribosyltransferase